MFTQSILRGVICCRLGYVINKKYIFHYKNDHFTPRNMPWCERYFTVQILTLGVPLFSEGTLWLLRQVPFKVNISKIYLVKVDDCDSFI